MTTEGKGVDVKDTQMGKEEEKENKRNIRKMERSRDENEERERRGDEEANMER